MNNVHIFLAGSDSLYTGRKDKYGKKVFQIFLQINAKRTQTHWLDFAFQDKM